PVLDLVGAKLEDAVTLLGLFDDHPAAIDAVGDSVVLDDVERHVLGLFLQPFEFRRVLEVIQNAHFFALRRMQESTQAEQHDAGGEDRQRTTDHMRALLGSLPEDTYTAFLNM